MTDTKLQGDSDQVKDFVLRSIYYNQETGFQNQKRTYEAAKKRLSDITPEYVAQWFKKQKGEQLKPYRGFNSYIVDGPNQEVAADLADFSRNAIYNRGYRYIFIAVDAFTKFAHAVPMMSKNASDCAEALEEVLNNMGNFKTLFTDGEPAFESKPFIKTLNNYGIHHIISSAPSGMAERAVGTFKSMIARRITGLDLDKEQWIDLLPSVLHQYNRQVHSTTGFTPIKAQLADNRLKVWYNIKHKAKFNRVYEPIEVGDTVRTYIKITSFSKGADPRFSETTYKVTGISKNTTGDEEYTLNSKNKSYLRHELRLVKKMEDHTTI